MTEEGRTLFQKVSREPNLSDQVSALMLETILSPEMRVGDRLPSERELGEQFGVSRTVVREAVRALVAKGVIEVRRGTGLHIAAVDQSAVSESMSLYLRASRLDFNRVHEVRQVLEVHIAGIAANRATASDVDRMRAAHVQMQRDSADVAQAAKDDLEFHRMIANATHNDLYLVMMDTIVSSLIDIRRRNLGSGSMPSTINEHELVLTRISDGDEEQARRAMSAHLDSVQRIWRQQTGP